MRTWKGPGADKTAEVGNQGGPGGVQVTVGGDSGGGCIVASDQRPSPTPRSVEEDEGLVQSGSGQHPAARTSHT